MKNRIYTRSKRTTRLQPLMAEPLELRQMCSGTLLTLLASPTSVAASQIAMGAGNLAVDQHGSIWYTTDNSLEMPSAGGISHHVVPPASNGSSRTIVSNMVFTLDNSAWFVVAENAGNRLERMTATGTFQDMTAVTSAELAQLTVRQNAVWFIQSGSSVGFINATGGTTSFAVPGTTLAALTTGPDGNVWFAGAAVDGQGVVGKVTPAGDVAEFPLTGAANTIVAGKDGYVYAGGPNEIWRVSTTGSVTEALHGNFTPQSLTSASDGTLWFIDAAHPDRAITRMGGNVLLQYRSGIPDPTTVNSLIATGADLWFTAVGSSVGWLGEFQTSSSSVIPSNGTYTASTISSVTSNACDVGNTAQMGGLTLYGGLTVCDAITQTLLNGSGINNAAQDAARNSSDTGNNDPNTNAPPASAAAAISGLAASTAEVLRALKRQDIAQGAAASNSADGAPTSSFVANANQARVAGKQDPATFEGEFRIRAPEGNTLPRDRVTHPYYSSTGISNQELSPVAGHWGEVSSAGRVTIPLVEFQPVAARTPGGQMTVTQVVEVHGVTAWKNPPPPTLQMPITSGMDFWRFAAYVSAAAGLQGYGPANKRFGE